MVDFRERKRQVAIFLGKKVFGFKTGQRLPKWFMYTFFPLYSIYLHNTKMQWLPMNDELIIEGVIVNTGMFYHLRNIAKNNADPNRSVTYDIGIKIEEEQEWRGETWIRQHIKLWRADLMVTAFDKAALELRDNLVKRVKDEIVKSEIEGRRMMDAQDILQEMQREGGAD
jgi:hypothetical protein